MNNTTFTKAKELREKIFKTEMYVRKLKNAQIKDFEEFKLTDKEKAFLDEALKKNTQSFIDVLEGLVKEWKDEFKKL